MSGRLPWAVIGLACTIQAVGIARTKLPSHDGLKLLRTAAQFQTEPWMDVVRATDRHPLYPMLVAVCEPFFRALLGPGADTWRITAQTISGAAAVLTLVPLYLLSRRLFGAPAAWWTCLLWTILPIPAEIGHDTVADSVALSLFAVGLLSLLNAGGGRSIAWAVVAGVCAGAGYWTKPESALLGGVGAVWLLVTPGTTGLSAISRWSRAAALLAPLLIIAGGYVVVKGELSEKLALRRTLGLPPSAAANPIESPAKGFPAKLDDEPIEIESGLANSVAAVGGAWARVLGVLLAPLAGAGLVLAPRDGPNRLLRWYLLAATTLLIRHVSLFHYLSSRHLLTLGLVVLPWVGWRLTILGRRVANWLRLNCGMGRACRIGAASAMVAAGLCAQNKELHDSREAHWQAGRWLAAASRPEGSVFDTHGWAAFVASRAWHDPWHLRHALADSRLKYFVVEAVEIDDPGPRGEALRSILAKVATPVARFRARGGAQDDVLIYEHRAILISEFGPG